MTAKTIELKDFEGCYLPPEFCVTKERIEHFDVRNDDVWVTSYPKAGTTWTQEMVWLIANDLDYERAKVDLDERFPFIEANSLIKSIISFLKKINNPAVDVLEVTKMPDYIKVLNDTKERRFIKTHLPFHLLPRQITDGFKTPKIVHVMRDPKQVSVSYHHHNTGIFPIFLGSLDEFIDLYIDGKVEYGSYFKVVESYLKKKHLPNLLLINYEEMHDDLKGVIRKVSDFLGKNYSDEEVEKLAHHLSFDQMKQNKAVNRQQAIQDDTKPFIRTGTKDDYKQKLTQEMVEKLDKWVLENVKGTGLPYEKNQ